MYNKRSIGKKAESLAALFLKQKNFEIIERNYYSESGEIDIIAKDRKNVWHFVEVKSKRLGSKFGTPEEAVDEVKQKRIIKTVEVYLEENRLDDVKVSLDIVVIVFNRYYRVVRIELLKGDFE